MNYQGKVICVKKCDNCGKNIEIRHKTRLTRLHIFCSKECEILYKRTLKEKDANYYNCQCPICAKKFHLKPYNIKKAKVNYCSKECHRIAKTEYMKGTNNHQFGLKGKKNASWKTEKKTTNYGYIKIRSLNHPFKDCDGFVFEHRLVAEKYLLNNENSIEINGKLYLKPEYTVHHIDENKKNNNPSNLKIMLKSEHSKLHIQERIKKQCKPVKKIDINGKILKTYKSIKEAAKENNIYPQNISNCCKNNNRTAGGYFWEYK